MKLETNSLPHIPQKQPFVMIDKLLYTDEKSTRSSFVIQPDNLFVEDGIFGAPGLVENIAQTAAARVGYIAHKESVPVPIGYIGAIKNLKIFALPGISDELETEITIGNQIFNVTVISGKIKCNNSILAECEMKIFLTESKL